MRKWGDLSIKDKAAFMKLAVKNGITDIDSIKETYESIGSNNIAANGGDIQVKQKEKPLPYYERARLNRARNRQLYGDGGNKNGFFDNLGMNTMRAIESFHDVNPVDLNEVKRAYKKFKDKKSGNFYYPSDLYLMSPEKQAEMMLTLGYISGEKGDYGTAAEKVARSSNQHMPVYQRYPHQISRDQITPIGRGYRGENFESWLDENPVTFNMDNGWLIDPQGHPVRNDDRTVNTAITDALGAKYWDDAEGLIDAGNYQYVLYRNPDTGDLYTNAWDVNNYADKQSPRYQKYPFTHKIAANILDAFGNPFVQTLGYQKVPLEGYGYAERGKGYILPNVTVTSKQGKTNKYGWGGDITDYFKNINLGDAMQGLVGTPENSGAITTPKFNLGQATQNIYNKLTNKASSLLGGDASGLVSAGLGMIGGVANQGFSKLFSNGLSSGVGNAIGSVGGTVGSLVGAVNPVLGAGISAATGILGGITNTMFGSKLNQEHIAAVENSNTMLNNTKISSNDTTSALNDISSINWGADFTKRDIGRDGWFSNKAKNKYNELSDAQSLARNRAMSASDTAVSNIATSQRRNAMANFSAYGGPVNKFGDGGMKNKLAKLGHKFSAAAMDMLASRTGVNPQNLNIIDALLPYFKSEMQYGPEYRDDSDGAAQSTYLLPRWMQREIMKDYGYIEGEEGDYGPIASTVHNKFGDVPVWQTAPHVIDENRVVPIGMLANKDNQYSPWYARLHNAGSYPTTLGVDPVTNTFIGDSYDLNNYGDDGNGDGGAYSRYSKIGQMAVNLLDKIGSPIVVTTGRQPLVDPETHQVYHYGDNSYLPRDIVEPLDEFFANQNMPQYRLDDSFLWTLPNVTVVGKKKKYGGRIKKK